MKDDPTIYAFFQWLAAHPPIRQVKWICQVKNIFAWASQIDMENVFEHRAMALGRVN